VKMPLKFHVHHISEIKRLSDVATSISLSTSCYIKAELVSGFTISSSEVRAHQPNWVSELEMFDNVSRESNKLSFFL